MARSIKYESEVHVIKCSLCKKAGFTDDNPPVRYKGLTDHLLCFAVSFAKEFAKQDKEITVELLQTVPPLELAGLRAIWAALLDVGGEAIVVQAKSKRELEQSLSEEIDKSKHCAIAGIYNKGVRVSYKTKIAVHIADDTNE